MSTPKNEPYKQRQAEFRRLNKRTAGYSVRRGNWNTQTQLPTLDVIQFKEIIHSEKE